MPRRRRKQSEPDTTSADHTQPAPTGQLKLKLPLNMLIAAPPEQGKSTLIRYLIYNLARAGQFHYGWCFSTTAFNGDYSFVPREFLSDTLTPAMLESIMAYQKSLAEYGPIPPAFLILDDMIGSINPNMPIWNKLYTTFRHYNLSIFTTTQYIYKLPPTLRTCCTYAVTFTQFNKKSYDAVYDSFMQDMDNAAAAKKFITDNAPAGSHRFIMIRNNSGPTGRYTVGKAEQVRDFTLDY